MTKEKLRNLIKKSLSSIEKEMQTETGRYVTVSNKTITDILMGVYGEDILKTYETFYKEFIND